MVDFCFIVFLPLFSSFFFSISLLPQNVSAIETTSTEARGMSARCPLTYPALSADASAACEMPSDSELLEQLDIDAELASFLLEPTFSDAAGSPSGQTSAPEKDTILVRPSVPPRALLIGGSLFEPRPTSLNALSRLPYRYGWPAATILATAVFCPFTHQFVSLASPHWHRLCNAGFGLSPQRFGTPRVTLRSVARLCRYARALQSCGDAAAKASPAAKEVTAPSMNAVTWSAARTRRQQLYESWGWSPSLQRSLGAMLCTAPLSSASVLADAIKQQLQTDYNYAAASVIDVAVGNVAGVEAADAPWRTRWRDLQWSPLRRGENPPPDVGESQQACCVRWADQQQQLRASEPVTAKDRQTSSPLHPASSSLPDWAAQHMERQMLPLLGLPSDVRAAFLELPFSSKATQAPALMQAVCAAVVSRLSQGLTQAATSAAAATGNGDGAAPRLYYCPLAHGIDYSAVLDLRAFPVPLSQIHWRTTPSHGAADALADACMSGAESATPVLSLGMDDLTDGTRENDRCGGDGASAATPSTQQTVVVFDNAHFLSKRAMSRLLDQWTRNGSALRRHHESRTARQRGRRPARPPPRWQTLLGSPVPIGTVLPHLRTLAPPFGDVQALFLSYRPRQRDEDTSVKMPATAVQPSPAFEIAVSPEPKSDLLYLEESLSAALLRVSAVYRLRLTALQRRELLESVVRSALHSAGDEVMCVKRVSRKLPSGKSVADTAALRLATPKGQAILYEACEAVLAHLSPLDALLESTTDLTSHADQIVRVLTMYPMLSKLRVRHVLLSTYGVHVTPEREEGIGKAAVAAVAAKATTQMDDTLQQRHATTSRVSFLAARQEAYARQTQEQRWLLNQARVHAAAAATPPPPPTLYAHTYSLYAEPPLLVGRWWTATLLFCAPTLADVVSLRSFLLSCLRRRQSSSSSSAVHHSDLQMQCDDGNSAGAALGDLLVEDVDIFATHLTSNEDASRPRSRVFGVRALASFAASPTHPPPPCCGSAARRTAAMNGVVKALEQELQRCLKSCASKATFFPLWTYRGAGKATPGTDTSFASTAALGADCEQTSGRGRCRGAAATNSLLPFAYAAQRPACTFFDFNTVTERHAPWVPPVVERRLFTLAVAQRPTMVLTVGARVVLRAAVHVPGCTRDCGTGGSEGASCVYPRSSVCRVVGFLTLEQLTAANTTAARTTLPGSIPPAVRRQVEGWSPAERQRLVRYIEQQQHASALPLLQCERVTAGGCKGGKETEAFLVVPQPALIGGYRSTHYYGLPVLHLPLCVLTGSLQIPHQTHQSRMACWKAQRAKRFASRAAPTPPSPPACGTESSALLLTSTSPCVALDFVLTDVFHPYHADALSSASALCLTQAERTQALRLLFAQMTKDEDSSHSERSGDVAASPPTHERHTPISFMEDILFYEASESSSSLPVSAASAAHKVATASTAKTTSPMRCTLLTELALYARRESVE